MMALAPVCDLCSCPIFVPLLSSFHFSLPCLDWQEVTGQQQVPMKHSRATLAILWLHFKNRTVWVFPLHHYMNFRFPE